MRRTGCSDRSKGLGSESHHPTYSHCPKLIREAVKNVADEPGWREDILARRRTGADRCIADPAMRYPRVTGAGAEEPCSRISTTSTSGSPAFHRLRLAAKRSTTRPRQP